jgi:serine/threonine protein kinase
MDNLPDKFINAVALHPGKSAEVFVAKNSLTGRQVFLKRYPVPTLDSYSALREPHLLTELAHDNLVKIYSADVIDYKEVRLEMEFVNGGSFQAMILEASESGNWPSIHECIRLVADVASGLSHLAGKGFVHRDVKPANLVIRKNGGNRQGVVADLGLATRVGDSGRAFATKHARIYRPPEVWQGQGYSIASDVYQLGIVLFQLLGGYLDHELADLDDAELASIVAQSKIISLDSVAADVGPALRKIIKRAVSLEGARYRSMSEFIIDLGRAKVVELDWSFSSTNNGFSLERIDGKSTYRVEVEDAADKVDCFVRRSKSNNGGSFRQKNPPLKFPKRNLETNKLFRKSLTW